jgi:hypothetical protein
LGAKEFRYAVEREHGIYVELVQPRIGRGINRRKRDVISLE